MCWRGKGWNHFLHRGRSGASYVPPPGIFPRPHFFSPRLLGDNLNKGLKVRGGEGLMCVILIKVCVLAYMAHVWFLDNCTHSHTPTHMSLQNCLLCATISHTAHKLCVCCAHFFRPSPSLTCPSIYDSDHRSRATHTHTHT